MDLRLISYNMNGIPGKIIPIKETVQWLVKTGNLVALQEIWFGHAAWAAAFAAHGWVFLRPAREQHFAALFGSGLAFAWPAGRWQLQEARQYPFLSYFGLDIALIRSWFQIEMVDPESKQSFRIVNTHMQSDLDMFESFTAQYSEPVRIKQARQIVASLARQMPKPTLIIGDINTETCPFSPYQYLHTDSTATYPRTDRILDHCASLATDGWTLLEHRVFEQPWSDHYPALWCIGL